MPSEQEHPTEETSLQVQSSSGLVRIEDSKSSALVEIINRSLIHIQTSKALSASHRIGEHELHGPDYRLVCTWAEELQIPEEVFLSCLLAKLHADDTNIPDVLTFQRWFLDRCLQTEHTTLVDGRFKRIFVAREYLPISGIPAISGLTIDRLRFYGGTKIRNLGLSCVPELRELYCASLELDEIDLSAVPNLIKLDCSGNSLHDLRLSAVPNLTDLHCRSNNLVSLELSSVPKLQVLDCSSNKLSELNLAPVPHLKQLYCSWNRLSKLDVRMLKKLNSFSAFNFDDCSPNPRILKRRDQDFC
jgi:Leucine-rich repeat (LRR) protein